MSVPEGRPANSFDRCGLQLVEAGPPKPNRASVEHSSPLLPRLSRFDWGLLASLATLQLAYLGGWAVFVRWAVRRWIGA